MSDKKIPNPEEIQKDFEKLIKNKYGDSVQFFTSEFKQSKEEDTTKKSSSTNTTKKNYEFNFDYKPKEIKEYLDRFVVKQDEAKKALAIAVCDHYNQVKKNLNYNNNNIKSNYVTNNFNSKFYVKQNILFLGPTGVGKTYLIKSIANLIGVPFIKADATRFSETGYVGANVDDLIKDLVNQADNDIEIAQYGMVYLDEADKLASSKNIGGKDVSGRGVQIGLLKLMEETEVDLQASHDMVSQIQAFIEFQKKGKIEKKVINTKHILFIVSGAFSGLEQIIKNRLNYKNVGISSNVKTQKEINNEDIYQYATTSDYIEFGFEPEFIGRLPIRVSCKKLNTNDLYKILKESEGSIIKQYIESFKAFGIKLFFTDEALWEIAKIAHKEETGARALMTTCEFILRDYKFELPSTDIKNIIVTKEIVRKPKEELNEILNNVAFYQNIILQKNLSNLNSTNNI